MIQMAYLNYNSTNAPLNQHLNISDIGYDQIAMSRRSLNALIVAVKRFVNAPKDAKVIFNSGATESIATVIHWMKTINPYGAAYGTDFDHASVRENCKNFEIEYKKLDKKIPRNASGIILTHVNGSTGEYIDMDTVSRNIQAHTFMNESDASVDTPIVTDESKLRQYKPIVVLDAAQSVTKLKIDMEKWNLNAVFWSMHKIGGPQGLGVMVIKDDPKHKFRPLIAGHQQGALRGGTLALDQLINTEKLLKLKSNVLKTKAAWIAAVEYLEASGIDVVKPTKKHLYNTILIRLNQCPLGIINQLSRKQIYVGAISSCSLEQYVSNPKRAKEETESFIRLSFVDPVQVDRSILKNIIDVVKSETSIKGGDREQEFEEDTNEILPQMEYEDDANELDLAFA